MPEFDGFVEPEAVEASHLVRVPCVRCGANALCASERAQEARCALCHGSSVILSPQERTAVGYTVPVGYPSPLGHHDRFERLEVESAYPRPVVTSRDDRPEGMQCPAPVRALCDYAAGAGWKWRRTYSRGCMPHSTTGRPTAERHLWAVSFGGHPETLRGAYAVYSRPVGGATTPTWAWMSVWIYGPDLPAFGALGITSLKAYLSEYACTVDSEVIGMWVDDLRTIAANATKLKKAAAKSGTGKVREHA